MQITCNNCDDGIPSGTDVLLTRPQRCFNVAKRQLRNVASFSAASEDVAQALKTEG